MRRWTAAPPSLGRSRTAPGRARSNWLDAGGRSSSGWCACPRRCPGPATGCRIPVGQRGALVRPGAMKPCEAVLRSGNPGSDRAARLGCHLVIQAEQVAGRKTERKRAGGRIVLLAGVGGGTAVLSWHMVRPVAETDVPSGWNRPGHQNKTRADVAWRGPLERSKRPAPDDDRAGDALPRQGGFPSNRLRHLQPPRQAAFLREPVCEAREIAASRQRAAPPQTQNRGCQQERRRCINPSLRLR